jgi:hypothetical protein
MFACEDMSMEGCILGCPNKDHFGGICDVSGVSGAAGKEREKAKTKKKSQY